MTGQTSRQPSAVARPSVAEGTRQPPEEVLAEGLSAFFSRPLRITGMECRPLEERSTHPIDRLRVTLDSGEQLPVIFKRLTATPPAYPAHGSWLTAHGSIELPKGNRREVLLYRQLLAGRRFGAPALYASVYDEDRECYWLFLEDVGAWTLGDGDLEDWLTAARWLGELHGTYWRREHELRALGCLDEHGAEYYHTIAQVARWNLQQAGTRSALDRFDRLIEDFDSVVAFLVGQPRTLVHGDIFAENLVLQPAAVGRLSVADGIRRSALGGRRNPSAIRPVDWESAAIGLAAWDLARLMEGWETDQPILLATYLDELVRHTGTPVDQQVLDRTIAHCEILNLLWHLAWDLEACRDAWYVEALLDALDTATQAIPEARLTAQSSKLEAGDG